MAQKVTVFVFTQCEELHSYSGSIFVKPPRLWNNQHRGDSSLSVYPSLGTRPPLSQ